MLYRKQCSLLYFFLLSSTYTYASILTSIKPLGFIASAITHNIIPVEVLLPYGASEHKYILRPSDIKRLKYADLTVWIDPTMEVFLSKAIILTKDKNIQLSKLNTIKNILYFEIEKDNLHMRKYYNMHLWLSPDIAIKTAEAIYKKLLSIMPEKKDTLKINFKYFEKNLQRINHIIFDQISKIKNKRYFVFHNAFIYFEQYFGLSPTGYFTMNPNMQLGARSLYNIKKKIIDNNVTCIFSEPQLNTVFLDNIIYNMPVVKKGILDPLGKNIDLGKDSYIKFLLQLSNQYFQCLKN